jgi:hypothetical protein
MALVVVPSNNHTNPSWARRNPMLEWLKVITFRWRVEMVEEDDIFRIPLKPPRQIDYRWFLQ